MTREEHQRLVGRRFRVLKLSASFPRDFTVTALNKSGLMFTIENEVESYIISAIALESHLGTHIEVIKQ